MNSALKLSEKEVQDIATKITDLDLSKEDEALLLAGLYMTNSRVEEAIHILKDLINNSCRNPGIHRILGDIYFCTDQPQLAQDLYEKELSLLGNNPPCIERLAAKAGLAQIETRNKTEAQTQQFNQDIEKEFDTIASDRQESAMGAAIRNLNSRDMQLASVLTSLTTNCPVSPCNTTVKGQLIKSHHFAPCITCRIG